MSLSLLISQAFAADDPHGQRFRVRKEFRHYHNFKPVTVKDFGWELMSLICQPIVIQKRRHYGFVGFGYIVSDDLRCVFSNAGFADVLMFTTVATKNKRPTSNYYDHSFDPTTAQFNIRVGLREGSNQPDWNKLNKGVSDYLLMAALKRPA